MHLDLTYEEVAALLKELDGLIDGDRYFLSPRIKTLKAIRSKIRPEPVREPLPPPPKRYEPPRATAKLTRRWRTLKTTPRGRIAGHLTVNRHAPGSLRNVIPEIDIWRVANLMLKRYGEEADIESAIRAEELAEKGDWTGEAIWRRIIDAMGQLENTTPPGPLH
jgi:hypothetical protein